MKIGIYGDSFAASHKESTNIAWFNVLPKLISNSNTVSYGMGATSVYYSYKLFLETYTNYDQIIFLVTEPGRYTKPVTFLNFPEGWYFGNITHVENLLKKDTISGIDKKMLEHLLGWFFCADDDFHTDANELMLRHIETLHEKVLFFPCFNNSLKPDRLHKLGLKNNQNAITILFRQIELLKDFDSSNENLNTISCHLTEEFNLFLAEVLATKLLTNIWNFDKLNDIKLIHDTNYYLA